MTLKKVVMRYEICGITAETLRQCASFASVVYTLQNIYLSSINTSYEATRRAVDRVAVPSESGYDTKDVSALQQYANELAASVALANGRSADGFYPFRVAGCWR